MFYYLNGEVVDINQNNLVLEINGIGFVLNTSLKTISSLSIGQKAKLYVSESIGENNFDLYGFSELTEKRFFELLISISGVGPKAAISLLSTLTTDALVLAIVNDDSKALTNAPGIGKKIAQRIVLELRDKLGAEVPGLAAADSYNISANSSAGENNSAITDAVAGLSVLGYSSSELAPFIRNQDWTGMTADQIIKAVLKNMV